VYATILGFNVPHIYRSTNFGGSWLNVDANLPDAPANALVVDPNDANTVYVAMDTGVYVTQAITTCATANCWSVLGTGLPNAPVVVLAAAANLPTGDGRSGLLRAATYGRGLWQTPLLTATSLAEPALTLSATVFSFAAQQVATQSAAQTLTLTSTGNAPVIFGTPVLTGDFTETDDCANQTIAAPSLNNPAGTCTAQIIFAPTATGARSGQLTIYANISGGQTSVALNGTGTAAASIVLTPLTLTFPATIINQIDAAQIITVANTGGSLSTLQTPLISGESSDFSINANTCGITLAPATACAISITFTPTASGARSATLSITDNIGTQTASLSGTGQAPATDALTPLALTFAQQQIGTTSAPQSVTLTNAGGVALTLIAASISPGDFAVVNACGNSLAAHSTCAFNVTFAPTAVGTRTASLSIADQFRTQTVALSGIGIAPPGVSLSPVALSFPATGVGLTAVAQPLTLTNNGGLPLTISSIAAGPGFTIAANTCSTTLAANTACTLTMVFAPTAAGPISGTLTFTDNAPSGTQTTTLSGTGVDFALTATGPTLSGDGATATYPMQLSSLSGLSGNVALTCIGAPAYSTCTVVPSIAPLGGTSTISVTVETQAITAALASPARPFGPRNTIAPKRLRSLGWNTIFLSLLVPIVLAARRRRCPQLVLLFALACAPLSILNGCATNRVIPASTTPTGGTTPTPNGTYTLVVAASSAGLTHTVNLTLVVQ
jgi:hypothetical protein